jgi:hypothetical protein
MNVVIQYLDAVLIGLFVCNWISALFIQRYVVKWMIAESQSNSLIPHFSSNIFRSSFQQSIDLFKVVFFTKRFFIRNSRLESLSILFRISICLQALLFLLIAYFFFLRPNAL